MKTLTVSQLWNAHWHDPRNSIVRGQIAMRDPGGIRQLQPISDPGPELVNRELIASLEEDVERLEREAEDAPSSSQVEELEDELETTEDRVKELETILAAHKIAIP